MQHQLEKAITDLDYDTIRLIINGGYVRNIRGSDNWLYTNVKNFEVLISTPGIDEYNKNIIIDRTVSVAFRDGINDLVRLLLKLCYIDLLPYEPLHMAAGYGHQEIVKLLLLVPEIDVNARNKFNKTALMIAAANQHFEIIDFLLSVPGIVVHHGILIDAVFSGNFKFVKKLVSCPGLNVNMRDKNLYTPLIIATFNNFPEIVKLLLKMPGIDINAKDKDNCTALIHAARNRCYEITKLLLEMPGININATDKSGNSALSLAIKFKHDEIIHLLDETREAFDNVKIVDNPFIAQKKQNLSSLVLKDWSSFCVFSKYISTF